MKNSPVLMLAILITVMFVGYMIMDSKKREASKPAPVAEAPAAAPAAPPAGAPAAAPVTNAPEPQTAPNPVPAEPGANARGEKELIKSTMRNVITAEEVYFSQQSKYSNDPAELQVTVPPNVNLTFLSVGLAGWGVRGTHTKLPGTECGFFVGNAPPVRPAKVMGQLQCSDDQ